MIDFPASPSTGQIFSAAGASWRYDGTKWVAYGSGSGNAGRNLIHNPLYAVQQRAAGPFTTNVYTADRWANSFVNGTMSTTIVALTDANRAAIGDEAAVSALRSVVTGSATAGSASEVYQGIEDVRRLAGKTVTVSLWAFAASGTPKIGVSLDQVFGGGGSPAVLGVGQSVTISTTPARYAMTFTLPSVAGKTIAIDSRTWLNIWYSGATDQNTITGSVGVQSNTFTLWGVQLEIGSTATPLEKPDPQQDLAKCQRFYFSGTWVIFGDDAAASTGIYITSFFPQTMRTTPTVTLTSQTLVNVGSISVAATMPTSAVITGVVTATGIWFIQCIPVLSADL